MVRVKMCGMTRIEDVLYAVSLGVDAIGFIFYEPSPRYINHLSAKKILAEIPPFVTTVGVFVNAKDQVNQILQELPLDLLQFHGTESGIECRSYGRPYLKVVTMNDEIDWAKLCEEYHDSKGFLLDAPKNLHGQSVSFDWADIPKSIHKPIILAGGLTPDNVNPAIQQVKPYAVDVTAGIEASKGIKDHQKMLAFMQAVRK